ncbi:MAG: hypothetical protein Q4615_10625 [Paracoccus aminovorans]|nr:hypothetical protein [Paracoccus aminovorans]
MTLSAVNFTSADDFGLLRKSWLGRAGGSIRRRGYFLIGRFTAAEPVLPLSLSGGRQALTAEAPSISLTSKEQRA